MPYSLSHFARDVHNVLKRDPGPTGREMVKELLQHALIDEAFVATHLGDHQPERRVLYEDAELGFLIVGHVLHEPKDSQPHDHGQTWAIYGQAAGESIMDHWQALTPATPDAPGTVRLVETHRLTPGSAFVYNEGAIHSPRRGAPAKLIRIEGGPIPSRLSYHPA
jgi:predicted metal-dependent enzyme (double-stranded beta helix superfamily)